MITTMEYDIAVSGRLNVWIPACGGTETPFEKKGRKLLYCFNPATMEHAYLDCDKDMLLSNEEAEEIFLR